MWKVLLVAVMVLSGCSVPLHKVVSTSSRSVTIQSITGDMAVAQRMADAECAKYARFARLNARHDEVDYIFDCVN